MAEETTPPREEKSLADCIVALTKDVAELKGKIPNDLQGFMTKSVETANTNALEITRIKESNRISCSTLNDLRADHASMERRFSNAVDKFKQVSFMREMWRWFADNDGAQVMSAVAGVITLVCILGITIFSCVMRSNREQAALIKDRPCHEVYVITQDKAVLALCTVEGKKP